MKTEHVNTTALILNILIIILEIIGFALAIPALGFDTLIFYTEDSNFLALIASILFIVFTLSNKELPKWLSVLKFIATLSVTVTFLVVVFVLSWMTPTGLIGLLTTESMLYHHTLCPILAIITFVFFERYSFTGTDVARSLYFTLIYAIVMISLNFLNVVDGPYPFLRVNFQPAWVTAMWVLIIFGFAYLMAWILKKSNEKFSLKKEK